jgi:hypothetical protein
VPTRGTSHWGHPLRVERGTVSLGLGSPPRCRMGVNMFCARSAVSQHPTPTHRSGALRAATSPHACLRSYMVGPRHISSILLTTFLSLVSRSAFRELGCLDPTTRPSRAWSFSFSPGGEEVEYAAARVVSVHAKSYDSSCDMVHAVLTPPLPPARVARVVGPAVLSISKFKCVGVQVHWLGGRLCFGVGLGVGGGGGGR